MCSAGLLRIFLVGAPISDVISGSQNGDESKQSAARSTGLESWQLSLGFRVWGFGFRV